MPTPTTTESILKSIKKLLLIPDDYTAFDADLVIHINTFLSRLNQIGVGVPNFAITDAAATWSDFLTDETKYQQAKSYVYLRVRAIFDPPTNGTTAKAFEDNARELEWLLYVDADSANNPLEEG